MPRPPATKGLVHPGFNFIREGGEIYINPSPEEDCVNLPEGGRVYRAYDEMLEVAGDLVIWSDPSGDATDEEWDLF